MDPRKYVMNVLQLEKERFMAIELKIGKQKIASIQKRSHIKWRTVPHLQVGHVAVRATKVQSLHFTSLVS